ncbi:MAG: cell division protein FtsA [Pseudomonadota bacterium]
MAKQTQKQDLLVGVDIGTSKIVVIVGEVIDGNVHVIGIGSHPSTGLKRGVVVNIETTVAAIQKALEEAALMAGCQIHSAFAGIAGSHIRSFNSNGIVAIQGGEVSQADVNHVVEAAKAVAIPADQKVLHILPQEFIVDGEPGIKDPVGMSGVRLEAKVHIITGAVSSAQNIIKCVRRCNIDASDIILEPLASSYAVLTEDEKELGVALIDIGCGTTDLAVFTKNAIRHSAVIPIAGQQVTNDIAIALRTPAKYAEKIKLQHGCALLDMVSANDIFEVPGVGHRNGQKIARQTLAEVCGPRYEELFELVKKEMRRAGIEDLIPAGIVLTGGGSKIEGGVELAEKVFRAPVRVGVPESVTGLADVVRNPIYATGIGLLRYAHEQYVQGNTPKLHKNIGLRSIFGRMRGWFKIF